MTNQQSLELYTRIQRLVVVNWQNLGYTTQDLIQDVWLHLKLNQTTQELLQITDQQLKGLIRVFVYKQLRPKLPVYKGAYEFTELDEVMRSYIGLIVEDSQLLNTKSNLLFELLREVFIEAGADEKIKNFLKP